uniref:Glycosyltransferase 2-like domain-containing protein n=1 Tax=Araucaria cunninghamii TaxID=56994 RepID=A0A0D6R0U1_ARACU
MDLGSSSVSLWMFLLSFLALFLLFWVLTYALDGLRAMESSSRFDASTTILEDPTSLKKVPCPSIFDPPEKYMSLIIPAYNEESRLPGTVDETLSYLQQRAFADKSFSYEVIIVDDGSTDGTLKVAFDHVKKFSVDNVRVIRLGANYGKGAAIKKHSTTAGNASCSWGAPPNVGCRWCN